MALSKTERDTLIELLRTRGTTAELQLTEGGTLDCVGRRAQLAVFSARNIS